MECPLARKRCGHRSLDDKTVVFVVVVLVRGAQIDEVGRCVGRHGHDPVAVRGQGDGGFSSVVGHKQAQHELVDMQLRGRELDGTDGAERVAGVPVA